MLTAAAVKQAARDAGADLVGIASPDRFAEVPPERSPLSIFPDAKSIIVVGRRITRGSLRGVEEGTHFNSFHLFGYHSLDSDFLALTTFSLVSALEDRGWEATPLFPYPPEAHPQGVPVREGQPGPNVIWSMPPWPPGWAKSGIAACSCRPSTAPGSASSSC